MVLNSYYLEAKNVPFLTSWLHKTAKLFNQTRYYTKYSETKCHYCSAIHSTILKNQLNVDEGIVNVVRNGDSST